MNSYDNAGDIVMDNWKLVRLVGEGSFGRVFEAEREDFGITYKAAIKIISIPQSQAEITSARAEGMDESSVTAYFRSFVEEIVREFALMAQLKGTANIVSYEDHIVVPHEDGIGWNIIIRMELLTPLLIYSVEHKVSRRDIVKLGSDICRALELCQKFNIIHRDIKPENIFVSSLGDYKLGDFGIARTAEKTTSGLSKKGTYTYMAPEVYRGDPYGSNVDIYSLGIVLYRLLNDNRAPFLPEYPNPITHSNREAALLKRIGGEELPAPKNADAKLSEIVRKACAHNPKERYASPTDMRIDLEAISFNTDETPILFPKGDMTQQKSVDSVNTDKAQTAEPLSAEQHMVESQPAGQEPFESEHTELQPPELNPFDTQFIESEPTEWELEKTEKIFFEPQPVIPEEIEEPIPKKKSKGLLVACIAIVAVLLMGAGLIVSPIGEALNLPFLAGGSPPQETVGQVGEHMSNDLDEEIPNYITIRGVQHSKDLTELDLSGLDLTTKDIAMLQYLPDLTKLELRDNQITTLTPLSNLTNLTVLRLNGNQISDLSPLTGLTNLTVLNLSDNQISNISPLAGLFNIESLALSENPIENWEPVEQIANVWGRPQVIAYAQYEPEEIVPEPTPTVISPPPTAQQQTQPQRQQTPPRQPAEPPQAPQQQAPPQAHVEQQPMATVPNVVGVNVESARNSLQASGFSATVREERSGTVAAGSVISQSPASGSQQARGSTITLTVSTGMPTVAVPNVVGQSRSSARSALERAGFEVRVIEAEGLSGSGTVIEQFPAAGFQLETGRRVYITVQ